MLKSAGKAGDRRWSAPSVVHEGTQYYIMKLLAVATDPVA